MPTAQQAALTLFEYGAKFSRHLYRRPLWIEGKDECGAV